MSIITISRGSYSFGREIAEKVARRLGYSCLSREILLEASDQFNIPEVKLLHAIQDVPSFFDRFSTTRDRYIAYIQLALLRHLRNDNIVYHGMAGHFFVKNVQHVLKVRILADLEQRVGLVIKRDGITRRKAEALVKKIDDQRRRWGLQLYGVDPREPSLYDLVINTRALPPDAAADIICCALENECFQTTEQSRKHLADLVLAAELKAALIDVHVPLEITSQDGEITIHSPQDYDMSAETLDSIEAVIRNNPEVKNIKFSGNLKIPHSNPFHNI